MEHLVLIVHVQLLHQVYSFTVNMLLSLFFPEQNMLLSSLATKP